MMTYARWVNYYANVQDLQEEEEWVDLVQLKFSDLSPSTFLQQNQVHEDQVVPELCTGADLAISTTT